MFFVESGKLKIDVWEKENNEMNSTIINKGESTIVDPKLYHKFEALEPTIAYEIYWVKLFNDDIIRENFGGVSS
jgi:mannose-6-phosphate isomerase-like protein (cupin superfamily)